MGVRVAYGSRDKVKVAIEQNIIPKDSIIITDNPEAEMFFYDVDGNMRIISERNRFESLTEAKIWALKYPCAGHIFAIQNGSEWLPYIVSSEGELKPIISGGGSVDDLEINRIDGGSAKKVIESIINK